jgi:hypothetical protein
MIQQINLYQPIFRQQKKVFSAVAMLQVIGVVLLALAVIYAYAYRQVSDSTQKLVELDRQHTAAQLDVAKYQQQFPVRTKSKQLEQKVARQQRELGEKNQVLQALKKGGFGNTEGFSDYLEGFARQIVSGAWITSFSIAAGGKSVALGGSAIQPELVPAYIQHLSGEKSFKGLTFEKLELQRSTEEPWKVDFELFTNEAHLPVKTDG